MKFAPILLALAAPGIAHAQGARSCPGFESGGAASPTLADRYYGLRAAEILRLAIASDRARLAVLVSPRVSVVIWSGDSGRQPRGADRRQADPQGADAVIALVAEMEPLSFTQTLSMPGPISLTPERCAWAVTLLIGSDDPGQAISLRFAFEDGVLAEMKGTEVGLIQGRLP